jgi:hypothetical protein
MGYTKKKYKKRKNRLVQKGGNNFKKTRNIQLRRQFIIKNHNQNSKLKTNSTTRSGEQCSPDREHGFTCFSKQNLQKISIQWNLNHNHEDHITIKNSSKLGLWKQIDNKLKSKCSNEFCWIRQPFYKKSVKQIGSGITNTHPQNIKSNSNIANEAFRTFLPSNWLSNPSEWLSTTDIRKVMKQYERKYNDFLFIGPVPLDFASKDDYDIGKCITQELCNIDINKWINKSKTKIGIVFNLDPHDMPGSHWVGLYCCLTSGQVCYYDSFGARPEYEIKILIQTLKSQIQDKLRMTPTIYENKTRHQYSTTEGGVYSMYFIDKMLEGVSYDNFIKYNLNDKQINRYRYYFYNTFIHEDNDKK